MRFLASAIVIFIIFGSQIGLAMSDDDFDDAMLSVMMQTIAKNSVSSTCMIFMEEPSDSTRIDFHIEINCENSSFNFPRGPLSKTEFVSLNSKIDENLLGISMRRSHCDGSICLITEAPL